MRPALVRRRPGNPHRRRGLAAYRGPAQGRGGPTEDRRVGIDRRHRRGHRRGPLKAWRKQQREERLAWGPAWQDTGLVFTREDGTGYHPDFVTYRFEKLVAHHGLPRISLHKLRHLAASLQIAAGVDIAIVSKRLRHSSIKITNDTYGHMIGTIGRQAAEAAAALVPLQHRTTRRPERSAEQRSLANP